MNPMRPLAIFLSIGLPIAAIAATSLPNPVDSDANTPVVATDATSADLAEPTAKIVKTSRKKPSSATPIASTHPPRAQPSLETFPGEAGAGASVANQQPILGTERLIFDRAPLRVVVSAGRERRVYLPWEAALHLPAEASELKAQIIGSTLYITAQSGQPIVRIVAEGLEGQGMIPLDIQVRDQLSGVPDELEISVASQRGDRLASGRRNSASANDDDDEPPAPDLVQLSRYCSQQVYAPQRLIKPLPGVRAVEVRNMPVAGLYRGGAVLTAPIGAWRSANLYVTAVRFTNRSQTPVELDMDLLRGRWVAATPQHHVLARNGDDADTTAVCLVSEQPFDASRP